MRARIATNENSDARVATVAAGDVLKTVGSVTTVTAKALLDAMDRWPRLTESEQIVLDEIAANRGRLVPYSDIVDALYHDREDGGPEGASNVIKNFLCTMKQKTKANIQTQFGLGYRLVPREETSLSTKLGR